MLPVIFDLQESINQTFIRGTIQNKLVSGASEYVITSYEYKLDQCMKSICTKYTTNKMMAILFLKTFVVYLLSCKHHYLNNLCLGLTKVLDFDQFLNCNFEVLFCIFFIIQGNDVSQYYHSKNTKICFLFTLALARFCTYSRYVFLFWLVYSV